MAAVKKVVKKAKTTPMRSTVKKRPTVKKLVQKATKGTFSPSGKKGATIKGAGTAANKGRVTAAQKQALGKLAKKAVSVTAPAVTGGIGYARINAAPGRKGKA